MAPFDRPYDFLLVGHYNLLELYLVPLFEYLTLNECRPMRDDTKAAARQSAICIKNKKN